MNRNEILQLLQELHPRLISWAHRRTRSITDAEDLVQDVLVKVLANWQTFDPAKGSFKSWTSRIMANQAADLARYAAAHPTEALDPFPARQ